MAWDTSIKLEPLTANQLSILRRVYREEDNDGLSKASRLVAQMIKDELPEDLVEVTFLPNNRALVRLTEGGIAVAHYAPYPE